LRLFTHFRAIQFPKSRAWRPKSGPATTANSTWRCFRLAVRDGSWNSPAFCSIKPSDIACCAVKFGPQQKLKRDTVREHKRIFDAALSRDVEGAVRALEKHYETTAKAGRAVMSRVPRLVPKRARSGACLTVRYPQITNFGK
jgi:hypothetical protein